MIKIKAFVGGVVVFGCIGLVGPTPDVSAMPMFARKLDVGCATCHSTIPRLNETGYRFRAAGFRMPEDIGKAEDEPFELGDYFSGRIQARYDANHTSTGSVSSNRSQLTFHELTAYPTTGAFGKYFSSLVEISFAPEEPAEIENAYLRINRGNDERFFETRMGIFHPFEGFGASDRPLSIGRPYFQGNPANFDQTTFFKPWGFDQAGVEAGFDSGRTSVRGTVFNGLTLVEEEGSLKGFPAAGGPLKKPGGQPSSNSLDFQVFVNRILDSEGGGVSLYYYHGNLDLPVGSTNDVFQDTFDRVAFYASYPVVEKLHLLGAFQSGRDHKAAGGTFTSRGAFVEADVPVNEYATAGVRYDWFDPATSLANNDLRGVVGYVNVPFQNGLQFITEYQNKHRNRNVGPDRTDNIFQVRLIFIR